MKRTFLLTLTMITLFQGVATPLVACSDGETTTGKRVTLNVALRADAARAPFGTALGWQVTLSRALLSVGPQYYYEGATIFSMRGQETPSFVFSRLLSMPLVHAHPGHYAEGNARGEWLSSTSVDLVNGGGALGVGVGTTGVVRSGSFAFQSPAQGPFAQALGTNVIVLEGSASKGDVSRTFSASLTASDLSDAGGVAVVEGCAFQEAEIKGSGTVTATIDIAKWFELVEFEQLSAAGTSERSAFEGVVRNELIRGVRAGDRYTFQFKQD